MGVYHAFFISRSHVFKRKGQRKMKQRKQNQRDNKHCNFSVEELTAKIAFDNLVRNEAAPCLPLATNEYKNVFHGHTIPRCLQIFQLNHKKSVTKHGFLNLIVNTVEGKTKRIK